MTRPSSIHTGPPIARPPVDVGFHRPNPYHLQTVAKELLTMTTCPTAFTYEESAALWHELQAARADIADLRHQRDATSEALADAHAATREARAERDRFAAVLGAVRGVVALAEVGE